MQGFHNKETVIITGCGGFLGHHLATHLIANGFRVVGIDDFSGGYVSWLPNESSLFRIVVGDLTQASTLENAFEGENIVAVFHFAAYAAEGLSPFIRTHNYINNLVATARVINSCINHDAKLIYASSMAVYGNQTPPFYENMSLDPVDPYGIAKMACELDIRIASEQHGLRYSIFRPHNIVGTYQNIWDRYRNVMGIYIRKSLAEEPLLVYGDGTQERAFSDVIFYMAPLQLLIGNFDGETFNLGSDNVTQIGLLAELVSGEAQKLGLKGNIEYVEARHEVHRAFCDHSKAKSLLNFHDGTDLSTLVPEVMAWASKEPARQVRRMDYEVTHGLYSYWTEG